MRIFTRQHWGAVHGLGNPTAGAKLRLYLHHSAAGILSPSSPLTAEMAEVRRIEEFHAGDLTAANPRIAYTYLVAPSGRAFEGTGWGRIGAHTSNQNSSSYGVCLLMDGTREPPTPAAVQAVAELRFSGMLAGHLALAHAFLGHRDAKPTECPGNLVYAATVAVSRTAAVPVVTGEDAVAPMPTLRLGSGGKGAPPELFEAVRELQRRLGMPDKHRTGYFGAITEQTTKDFQRENGLKEDGIVGVRTWRALGT